MVRLAGKMSNCVTFQTKLSSIVDVLVQAAVAVIGNLVGDDSVLTLRLKVAQGEMNSEVLKKKLQTQNELITTRFASIMGILGKEAIEKIFKLVDETKAELMECEIVTVEEASPENSVKSEDECSQDVSMEKGEPSMVVNEEDCQLDPVILKGKDMSEGKGGRSWVWGHFTLLSSNKVQCGLCNNLLSYYKNTSGMLRHIRTRHPAVHQWDTPSIVVAATQTDPEGLMGQAEMDADMEIPEGRIGRSWVWDYFTLLNPNKVQCGLCQNMLSYNKNTSGMLRHIRTRHPAAILIGAAAAQTEPEAFLGQAELEVELDSSEGRGGRSWVWDHFTLFGPNKVRCSFCNNMLSYNKNTSGMLRHLRSRHPSVHQGANAIFGARTKPDLEDSVGPSQTREEKPEEDSGSTDPPRGP